MIMTEEELREEKIRQVFWNISNNTATDKDINIAYILTYSNIVTNDIDGKKELIKKYYINNIL